MDMVCACTRVYSVEVKGTKQMFAVKCCIYTVEVFPLLPTGRVEKDTKVILVWVSWCK